MTGPRSLRLLRAALAAVLLGFGPQAAGPAAAVEPDEVLADPALEARARELSKVIRCLVCQNESIDSSNADLARELRLLVRERLTAGDDDTEVLDFLVSRYGDFVLLRPRMTPANYLLWFGPLLVLLAGGVGVALFFRARRASPAESLSAAEQTRLAALLDEKNRRE